jgi:hypothetical protein
MMKLIRSGAACVSILGAGALAMTTAAIAHHSFAMFDFKHRITVAGTVTRVDWSNPHVYIELEGTKFNHYTVECASPHVLTHVGWKYNDVKVGDKVTLLINPLRDGQPGGNLQQIKLVDGRVLGDGIPLGGPAQLPRP